ncbi:uncharacterized protein RCO7_05035 [Rhynchosporium graminicola]|uniref:Uncharacterized protein n=1 Tax=Rhynchosporium graminicola TaxID=2792576 RepID=A0A1E1KDS1_9HELO|nr:uncharacterized protein RCO7_05035 [Rhynchosporium commune]
MRFATASITLAFATTLSLAAPTPSNNINSFFNIDANNINQGFNLQAFNQNDIANLLSGFDVSGFNNQFQQFNAQFDQQAIQLLLLQLGGNQFGNSNLNGIQDLSQFNVNSFANQFNGQFQASWNANEILGLLVQLGLVDNQQIQNQLILSQQFQLGSQSCLGF